MKRIGFIFLFFGFGVLPLFAQSAEQGADGQLSHYSRYEKVENSHLLAQGSIEQETDSQMKTEPRNLIERTERAVPASDGAPNSPSANSENSETTGETHLQWEKTQRIFKVFNDYELAGDEILTTLIIIAGSARLQGSVTENVLVLGGNVELGPDARVNGTLHLIGGQITGNRGQIARLQVSNRWQMIPAAVKLIMHPQTLGKPQETNLRLTLIKFVLFLFMYLLVVAVFPKPVNAASELLAHRPLGSILFSILMLVVIPLILVLLTVSIVGVPFMLLGLSLLLPLAICGKAALFLKLGSTLFSGRLKPLAVIFGYILYFMATALPYIDWITFLVFNTIGITLCLLSGLRMMRPQDSRRTSPTLPNSSEWESRSERV